MNRPNKTTRRRLACAAVVAMSIGVVGCSSDPDETDPTVPGDTQIQDNDVPAGVGTETDEGRNGGFESDEPSGNATNVND